MFAISKQVECITGCAKSRDLVAVDFSLRIEDAVLDLICATYPKDPHGKVATTMLKFDFLHRLISLLMPKYVCCLCGKFSS
ncbi:hypothetical protein CH333_07145 [candidate division WOR-3 bacterium JGI_Cruoil_03_44_89]|uniref:Uncharacterized protein n=1 Tax=candidate division WOR-3 bacterium JGI_Cruoil_03_44_89 TaxID=1973748 RepID=A0A235BSV0_UNCW3|nr:MAG: hypothetical protein CH333_07145 [candidate division WOR-3 bacterium JGI_Cruoil_03_44_89]